jgi:hypothetical protein
VVIDFLVQSIYVYFKKFNGAGLYVSTYILSLALTCNFILIFTFSRVFLVPQHTFRDSPWGAFIVMGLYGVPYFIFDHLLEKRYKDFVCKERLKFELPLWVYYVSGFIYFFCSVVVGLASFKYV